MWQKKKNIQKHSNHYEETTHEQWQEEALYSSRNFFTSVGSWASDNMTVKAEEGENNGWTQTDSNVNSDPDASV